MKYLYIHKLIWFILVVIALVMGLIIYSITELIYFIWNLRFYPYGDFFNDNSIFKNYDDEIERDKNVFDTFERWYNI